jgi:predicted HAD superfamily phosphohydrolase YqeG
MFAAALRAARCRPSECVVVGDSEHNDIVPAIARGMRAIRVAIEEPGPKETARMRSQPHCMKPLRSSRAGGAAWTKARSRFVTAATLMLQMQ